MLPEKIHYQLLKELESNPQISQRELSRVLEVSLGKVNYCLKALIARNLIEVKNIRNNANKPVCLYLLTAKGLESKAQITLEVLRHKQREFEILREEIETLRGEVRRKH